jgi:hypothetical protein
VTAPQRGLESRSLTLRGDPRACRDAATDVRALELVLTDVSADLHAAGRWASAYGSRCRQGVDLTDALVARCRAVVAALRDGADLLDRAMVDLDETRGLAGGHGLLDGDRLVAPAPDAPRVTWDAWRRCDELVTSVRRAERAARHGLERALTVPA